MNLIIDIGNTRAKVGVFGDGQLLEVFFLKLEQLYELPQKAAEWPVRRLGLSTVRDLKPGFIHWATNHFPWGLLINKETPLPIGNDYETPGTLGIDRLAAATGAWVEFPGRPSVVIDAGTCITTDLIDAGGVFRGGNISPGIDMRLRAMHQFTARLPQVEKGPVEGLLGRSTASALRNGAQLGAMLEVAALVGNLKQTYEKINVLVTGGDAEYFARITETEIFVRPHLVLSGLNKILTYNAEQFS